MEFGLSEAMNCGEERFPLEAVADVTLRGCSSSLSAPAQLLVRHQATARPCGPALGVGQPGPPDHRQGKCEGDVRELISALAVSGRKSEQWAEG